MHKNLANQSLARVRHTFKVRELDHLAGLQLGSPTRSVYAWHPRIVQLRVAAALHATKPTSTLADDYESAAANHRERGVGTSRRSGRQSNVRVGRQLSGGEAVELAVAGRPTAAARGLGLAASKVPLSSAKTSAEPPASGGPNGQAPFGSAHGVRSAGPRREVVSACSRTHDAHGHAEPPDAVAASRR